MDDIIELFSICQLLTADDLEVISFSASEHLKKRLLLVKSLHFKITTWAKICNTLCNTQSTMHVGSQLMHGKCFMYVSTVQYYSRNAYCYGRYCMLKLCIIQMAASTVMLLCILSDDKQIKYLLLQIELCHHAYLHGTRLARNLTVPEIYNG